MSLVVYPQLDWESPESGALSKYEGSVNCGPAACAGAANAALHGGSPVISHHDFRMKAGNPKDRYGRPAGTGTAMDETALQAYGVKARRFYAQSTDIARDALKAGHIVLAAIHYPYINANYPELSGQKDFNGEHFLALYGFWPGRYRNTKSYDSLYDGRHANTPTGPQRAPLRAYRGAMEQFRIQVITNGNVIDTTVAKAYGPGKGIFIVVEL